MTGAGDTCTGDANCPAVTHVHGCYADSGNCDAPTEHENMIDHGFVRHTADFPPDQCPVCSVKDDDGIGPLRIPKDPTKRADLYRMAGLSSEEAYAMDVWCATQQREYEARLRRAWERIGDEAMP